MAEIQKSEKEILLALEKNGGKSRIDDLIEETGLVDAAIMRASLILVDQNLIKIDESTNIIISITGEGKEHAKKGLPERRLLNSLKRTGGFVPIEKVQIETSLRGDLFSIGLGWLHSKKWAKTVNQKLKLLQDPPAGADERLLSLLEKKGIVFLKKLGEEFHDEVPVLKRRRLIEVEKKIIRELELTEKGYNYILKGIQVLDEVSQLTPKMISSGEWRKLKLRKYNIKAQVSETWPGKKQPYRRFLDDLKWRLIALGFQEMTGPPVEFMFFNCDALYMPQDHPAREIHDIYFIEKPSQRDLTVYEEYTKNVGKCHRDGWKTGSKGWGYKFSLEKAKHLVLRSQGTALSARMLINPSLEIPGKYYSLSRCYRPDLVDRTHLTEFNQVEGIVLGEGLTLRDLLGVLEKFASEIAGADKVRFRPDYFPFTEPSVELSAYKSGYGWLEFGGAGIFRPEVTLPLGIEVPVIAWGLGVDRIFMMKKDISDIRDLFTQDLKWLRDQEVI